MDHLNRFRVGNFEYSFHAVPTHTGWTTQIVQINHAVFPPETLRVDGAREFATEGDALAFAENQARDLAATHLR